MYYIICSYVHNYYAHVYIYICIYIYIALLRLTSKVPTVVYFPYITHLVPHTVLYFLDVVHSTRKQCAYLLFSERIPSTLYFILLLHRWQHPTTISTSFARAVLENIALGVGFQSLIQYLATPHAV